MVDMDDTSDMKIYIVQKFGYIPSLHTKVRSPSSFSSWFELPLVCKNNKNAPISDNHTPSAWASCDLDSGLCKIGQSINFWQL